ncbi:MAG: transporter substrate-binding domain-containing protein [Silvanigrellales bacterium]|nr:transporter substrate-binding domain-containing protein [Silvanigrellales bacterium]
MKTLVVALFGTAPWVVGAPGAHPKGPLADTVECTFQGAGLPLALKVVPMSRAYAMLEAGSVDAVAQGLRSAERDTKFVPSAEMSRSRSGWFTLARETTALTEFATSDFRKAGAFGVLARGAHASRLRGDGYTGGVEVAGESDALLRMLARGRFQNVFANEVAFKNLLATPEFSSLRVSFAPHFSDSGVIYFSKSSAPGSNPELLARLNESLRRCPIDRSFM